METTISSRWSRVCRFPNPSHSLQRCEFRNEPHEQQRLPSGIPRIDGTGRTLLPGLIDTHVHTMGLDTALKSALALAVTTEFDMGAAPQYAFKIKREQAEGKVWISRICAMRRSKPCRHRGWLPLRRDRSQVGSANFESGAPSSASGLAG